MTAYHFQQGSLPLLISMPHVGTSIPDDIAAQMLPVAHEKTDTDWHLRSLYNMAAELGASTIAAEYSRYVIDLNRSSDNANLYPGQDTTGLCPVDTFAKQPLYATENLPTEVEVQRRISTYWQPYHQQLQQELERLLGLHGSVVLWDAHSIASEVPRFFEGKLPDLNFGTADQKSCDASMQAAIANALQNSTHTSAYTHIFNGRFKGGFITRNYGQPSRNIHAIQLEMSQCIYMNEAAPYEYRPDLAVQVQPLLTQLLQACLDWNKTQGSAA
ncbi:MAG: N-formylglutamate deformylase [Burkholderiales bacterium]|nr:N-formylglutamate deformylase [Burkholderiales bacterium]MBI3729136.1 N-formylglutamate deformylase [Burkholderiales bacterium]